jgi:uncharacterized Zn-binding protein involved in type VI secretion
MASAAGGAGVGDAADANAAAMKHQRLPTTPKKPAPKKNRDQLRRSKSRVAIGGINAAVAGGAVADVCTRSMAANGWILSAPT